MKTPLDFDEIQALFHRRAQLQVEIHHIESEIADHFRHVPQMVPGSVVEMGTYVDGKSPSFRDPSGNVIARLGVGTEMATGTPPPHSPTRPRDPDLTSHGTPRKRKAHLRRTREEIAQGLPAGALPRKAPKNAIETGLIKPSPRPPRYRPRPAHGHGRTRQARHSSTRPAV